LDELALIFVRAPVPGRVKTRLAARLGDRAAAELYAAFGRDLVSHLEQAGIPFVLCFTPPEGRRAVEAWLPGRTLWPQQGRDLGQRMENAFSRSFAAGAKRVVLAGSDLPDLPSSIIREGLDALAAKKAVLGPAEDGGYYAVGFSRDMFVPAVFSGPRWGTDRVLSQTLGLLKNGGASVHLLPPWNDVDTPGDLEALAGRLAKNPKTAPETAACLARLQQEAR